jgi:predicted SAM-dependent methyltransferase
LQLGASRLEYLEPAIRDLFARPEWIHLGDSLPSERVIDKGLAYIFRHYSLGYIVRRGVLKLGRRDADAKAVGVDLESLYVRTNFEPWHYRRGERLPYPDRMFTYAFSEHFFEHLFLDEAVDLLRECRRVLTEGGVIRICVPDADLRTYAPPEAVGYPDRRMSFSHPSKHKTRWNVYSLCEALRMVGLRPIPLTYCDREGRYFERSPVDLHFDYPPGVDREAVFDMNHVYRKRSLIVDGIVSVSI